MNITKKICKNWSERDGYKPLIIVVHISAGSLTSMTSWFSTPGSQASSHYGIGKDGTVIQYVEEDKAAWTNGRVNNPTSEIVKGLAGVNPNKFSLTIENEGQDFKDHTEIQMRTLVELISDLSKRYDIPLDRKHILGHFEIDALNRPYCPSKDHSIMDEIVYLCQKQNVEEEFVTLPKRIIRELVKYI